MSQTVDAPRPVSPRERAIATILLASWWVGIAMWSGAVAIRRRFWPDELCCTVYALRDSSNPLELVRNALAYDIAPPLLHLLTWPVTQLFGTSPVAVRSVGHRRRSGDSVFLRPVALTPAARRPGEDRTLHGRWTRHGL